MALPNIFDHQISEQIVSRINRLSPEQPALWGKMSVDQMLAHCNVTYEMVYSDKHPKPGLLKRKVLQLLVKPTVVNEAPYKRSSRTAPAFLIQDNKDFAAEKRRLIDYIRRTQVLGVKHFEGKESLSFGRLSAVEWNNMFYKHLDHHLSQFGA